MNTPPSKRFPKKPASLRPLADGATNSLLASRIAQQQSSYFTNSKRYKSLYFTVRIIAVICSGLLPFFVTSVPPVAIGLSVLIVLATAVDTVFQPHQKWKHYSRAADLLFLWEAKKQPDFDEHRDAVEILLDAEQQSIAQLVELSQAINAASKVLIPPTSDSDGQQPQ